MDKEFKVFVGYFNKSHSKKTVGEFLFSRCSSAQRIAIMSRRVGSSGQVYCCSISFPSNFTARRAIKVLSGTPFDGIELIARTWFERSAANERRDINWRNKPWEGQERRRRERRHYKRRPPEPAAQAAPFAEQRKESGPRPEVDRQSDTVQLTPSEISSIRGAVDTHSLLERELQEMGLFVRDENPGGDRRSRAKGGGGTEGGAAGRGG